MLPLIIRLFTQSRRDDMCERGRLLRGHRPYEERARVVGRWRQPQRGSAESRASVETASERRAQRVVHRWRQPRRGERRGSCIGGDSLGGESAESRASVEAAPERREQRVVHRWRQPRRGARRESCIGGDSLGEERAESRASVETASARLNFS